MARAHPLSVLWLDDDPAFVSLLRRAVAKAGVPMEFSIAGNAPAAIALLRAEARNYARSPDVIVLDLNLPGMNGLGFLEWLRSDPEFAPTPVVVISGSHEPAEIIGAYDRGANAYIVKPVDFEVLVDTVTNVYRLWSLAGIPHRPPEEPR